MEFNGNSTDYEEKLNAVISKYPNQDFYIGITDTGTIHKPREQILRIFDKKLFLNSHVFHPNENFKPVIGSSCLLSVTIICN